MFNGHYFCCRSAAHICARQAGQQVKNTAHSYFTNYLQLIKGAALKFSFPPYNYLTLTETHLI